MATIVVETETMLKQEFEASNSSVLQMALAAIRITATTLTDISSVFARKKIPLAEVANHYHKYDCWIIVYDRVYDITNFLREHPGGDDILLEYAGRDATLAFRGTGHSEDAIQLLEKFEIGELPLHECIFRCTNGLKLTNLPK